MPIDLAALGVPLAIFLLVAGTITLSVTLAVAARLVDRLWDALAQDRDAGERSRPRPGTARVRHRVVIRSRAAIVAVLAAALVAALAWLAAVTADGLGRLI